MFVKTDVDAATDLTTLLKAIYNGNPTLQNNPLYIIAESYGGKFAVTLGLSVQEAIEKSELKLQLGGTTTALLYLINMSLILFRENVKGKSVLWVKYGNEISKIRHKRNFLRTKTIYPYEVKYNGLRDKSFHFSAY